MFSARPTLAWPGQFFYRRLLSIPFRICYCTPELLRCDEREDRQTVVVEQKTKLTTIDTKLPAMEQEKKVAAAARNFKEAGRVSAEMKALQALKEELDAALAGAALKLDACETAGSKAGGDQL